MASLIAVVCKDPREFRNATKFLHKEGVSEYYHIDSLKALQSIDNLTSVMYLGSAKELDDFVLIVEEVQNKGVRQRWQ